MSHGDEESILRRMEEQGQAAPRLQLRGLADDPDRAPALTPAAGRYVIMGELSRGAVGIVYQGRDFDVGRDVAIKVLRGDHLDRPEWVSRFVEEAQICGQLQHPGIVPVYELGIRPDNCPYFTMKLVRGSTLAAQLDERESVVDDRRRFLKIFEQVCQTMAYAHSRGVIHSDLKPANVMVGNFAEVQVIDWGFAKVLPQGGVADEARARNRSSDTTMIVAVRPNKPGSGSDTGNLLATPAYMAPEQAMGQFGEVDERSDVFSLGAILCEILTGLPPYTGDQGDLIEVAAQAKLEPAYERLDECGADPALIDLARRCLGPLRRHRPRNAGAVRKRLLEYLSAVEERAHRLQLETIESEARAERARSQALERRRERRQALTIWTIVLLAVLLGGGGYLWRAHTEGQHKRALTDAYDRALASAQSYRMEGNWSAALVQAKSAVQLAPSLSQEQTAGLLAGKIEHEQRAELLATQREVTYRGLLLELEEIRASHADEFDVDRTDASFQGAFLRRDPEFDSITEEEVAAFLKEGGPAIAIEIAGLIDFWAYVRRASERAGPGSGGRQGWRRLVRIALRIDADPARGRLREEWLGSRSRLDGERIRAIATTMELESASVRTLDLLGIALFAAEDVDPGIPLLRELQRLHPDDAWTNWRLAAALVRRNPPLFGEALRFARAAFALRPESRGLRGNLARFYLAQGRSLTRQARFAEALATIDELGDFAMLQEEMRQSLTRLQGQCARMRSLEPELDAILAGDREPAGAEEASVFAALASANENHVDALRLYERAIVMAQRTREATRLRAAAARESLLAGLGHGAGDKLVPQEKRGEYRRQAVAWMRSVLEEIAAQPGGGRATARRIARDWRLDPRLAIVRDDAWLRALPAEEQRQWQAYQADLLALVRRRR